MLFHLTCSGNGMVSTVSLTEKMYYCITDLFALIYIHEKEYIITKCMQLGVTG